MSVNRSTDHERRAALRAWLFLVMVTGVSWLFGASIIDVASISGRLSTALALFGIAFLKIEVIGTRFMGLDGAPAGLRWAFRAWIIVTLMLMAGLYAATGSA